MQKACIDMTTPLGIVIPEGLVRTKAQHQGGTEHFLHAWSRSKEAERML